jgi:tetratricopeptide (TPR) repeat protein
LNDHPDREELSALLNGDLPARRADAVILHLLQPCESCLAQAPLPLRVLLGAAPARTLPTVAEDKACEAAIHRAIHRALREERHLREQREQVDRAATVLASGGFETMQKLPRRMSALAKMEALLARSWTLRHDNPALMVQFATAAVWCASRLSSRRYGIKQVFDFQCRAHAELGNSLRVCDQLSRAASELAHARTLFELGTGDRFLEVRLIELEASLAADRRQFALASNNLLKVYEFYQQEGDDHMAGRALIKRGLYSGYAGDPEEGFRLLGEGLALIDETRDPSLVYAGVHNQFVFLIDCGRFHEASRFRVRHSRQLGDHGGRINEILFRWQEGRVDAGLGKVVRAELIFREAKQGLQELGRAYDAALLSLDLAGVLLGQGKAVEAQQVVQEAAKVFSALQIEREALVAVIMLRNAFEVQRATVALVKEVAAFVRRAENDPNARFEPERW